MLWGEIKMFYSCTLHSQKTVEGYTESY